MAMFVLDASATIAALAPDESAPELAHLLENAIVAGAIAPALWQFECENVLVQKAKRGQLSEQARYAVSQTLRLLNVTLDGENIMQNCATAADLAIKHSLSVYDAAYLELALRMKLPLATLDKRLASAAKAENVKTLGIL